MREPIGSGSSTTGPAHRMPKTSRRWLQPRVPSSELYRLAPRPPALHRIGVGRGWHWGRRGIRNWMVWAMTAFLVAEFGHWAWAIPVAVVTVFLYLASPRFHPVAYAVDPDFEAGSEEFQNTMGGITAAPFLAGNAARVFNDGDEFYPAMIEAIDRAERSITMEQYIFWDGKVGRRFAEAFAGRARAGVRVKLLVDAIGSATLGQENIRILEAAGVQLAWYHPIRWYTLTRANQRTHRKSIILDGRVAFTGGAGLADHWLGRARNAGEWRDMMIRVDGPAAAVQQAGFAQNWLVTTGEILTGTDYFPVTAAAGEVAVQTILSSPTEGAGAAATMYVLAIEAARQSIAIANPYFIPSGAFVDLLARARRRGARIRLLVAGKHNDTWWARQNSVRLYGQLMEAGVEIYEFEPSMLHHKFMVVDGKWATIGTANFDNRSFALNNETNLCINDAELVSRMGMIFDRDVKRARRIDEPTWRGRKLRYKLQEMAASVIEDQV
jgi:cardiolipin synthase A/B